MTVFEILPEYYLWNLQKKVRECNNKEAGSTALGTNSCHQGRDRVGGARQGEDYREETKRYKLLCTK